MKKLTAILIAISIILTLNGCRNTDMSNKNVTIDELLSKIRLAMNVHEGDFINPVNNEYGKAKIIIFNSNKNVRTAKEIVLYFEQPDKYKMSIKYLASAPEKVAEGAAVTRLIGNKLTRADKNGSIVDREELSDKGLKKVIKIINMYKNLMSLSVLFDVADMKLDPKKFKRNAYSCYKVTIFYKDDSGKDRDKYTYYIDDTDYQIRYVEYENSFVDNIKYKKFGDLTLPYSYKYTRTLGGDKVVYYISVEDFKVNTADFGESTFNDLKISDEK
jgi:hypothetical protein